MERQTAANTSFKFAVPRTVFLDALTRASVGLPRKGTTLPILNCVLIRAADELTLTCTDLDQTVETRVPGVALQMSGAAALPAKRLIEIVTSLPSSATIEVSVTEKRAKLVAGRAKFDVLGMSVEEFPRPDVPKTDGVVTTTGTGFVGLLNRVASHIASSEKAGSLPAIAGTLLEIGEQGPVLVGTDRHRIVRLTAPLTPGDKPLTGQFSIPKVLNSAIGKLFGEANELRIEGTRQKLVLSSADSSMTLRLISEQFPAYAQLLGFPSLAHVILERAALAAAVKRVATVATEERVVLRFTETELTLSAESADAGSGEDVVPCAFKAGETIQTPYALEYNPSYLIDALDAVQGEQVRLDFAGGLNPLFVRDAKEAPTAVSLAIVLPLHPRKEAVRPAPKGGK